MQFCQFLVSCSSTHGAPVPYGVGATVRDLRHVVAPSVQL